MLGLICVAMALYRTSTSCTLWHQKTQVRPYATMPLGTSGMFLMVLGPVGSASLPVASLPICLPVASGLDLKSLRGAHPSLSELIGASRISSLLRISIFF